MEVTFENQFQASFVLIALGRACISWHLYHSYQDCPIDFHI